MKSQRQAVLEHLKKNGSITSKEAFELYGATRLSSIIFTYRKMGYDITTMMIDGTTRYGSHCSYAKYILREGA